MNQERVRIFNDDADTHGRTGRVVSTIQARGRSTKHVVLWEDDGSKSTVLLQKTKGGKGQRFHLEPDNDSGADPHMHPMPPPQPKNDVITLKTRDVSKYAIGQRVHNLGQKRDTSGVVEAIDRNSCTITVRIGK